MKKPKTEENVNPGFSDGGQRFNIFSHTAEANVGPFLHADLLQS